ncbi:unnamed protein product [Phyllotreta striolata]|uniref:Uncharacterized protein n=1 Tax=Phyllotreta striolata TaxID=444603 RepID=A0A9N9XUE4_PHYSR|nr:unnamed protein product [Phyllotreta striolata]
MKNHLLLAILLFKSANGDENESSSTNKEVQIRQKFDHYFPDDFLHGVRVKSRNALLRNGASKRQDLRHEEYQSSSKWEILLPEFLSNQKEKRKPPRRPNSGRLGRIRRSGKFGDEFLQFLWMENRGWTRRN